MAKYYGSPWGTISGKCGQAVGVVGSKGKRFVKSYVKAKYPKSSDEAISKVLKKKYKEGEVSIRTINQTRVVYSHLCLVVKLIPKVLKPIWYPLSKKKPITWHNLFMKYNLSRFNHSIPLRQVLCSTENSPQIHKLLLSTGVLEPTSQITNVSYNKNTGLVRVKWDKNVYSNGSLDDTAFLTVIYYRIPEDMWIKRHPVEKTIKIWNEELTYVGRRGDGEGKIKISKNIDSKYLTVFLYFGDGKSFSVSTSFSLR